MLHGESVTGIKTGNEWRHQLFVNFDGRIAHGADKMMMMVGGAGGVGIDMSRPLETLCHTCVHQRIQVAKDCRPSQHRMFGPKPLE